MMMVNKICKPNIINATAQLYKRFSQSKAKPTFVAQYYTEGFSDSQIVVSPERLVILSCPVNEYSKHNYTGVEVKFNKEGELDFSWKGQYGFILLEGDPESRKLEMVSKSDLDWFMFDNVHKIHNNQSSELFPKGKCKKDEFHPFPNFMILLVSPAINLNLYPQDLVAACNAFYQDGITDWLLYSKIVVRQVQKVYQQKRPATPYADLAKALNYDKYGAKIYKEIGCMVAGLSYGSDYITKI